jgi:hypothetical protein
MNQGNKIKHAILVQKKVKDVLFVKIPEFVKEYMTLEILRMDGIKVFENIMPRNEEAIILIQIDSIERGTYLLHINVDDKFVVDTFEKI